MKVLMTADTVGGVWTYALDLGRGLGRHGVSVHLATMGARLSEDQREFARRVDNLTVHESRFRLEWMDEPWDDVDAAGKWLLGLEREIAPDVVHLNGYPHGALPWKSPVLMCAHSCVLSWWEAVNREQAPSTWDRYRRRVESGIRAADLVTAPTHAMLEAIRRLYLDDVSTVYTLVIPNGREVGVYEPGEKEPFVLSAGRLWDEAKNVAALVDVAERVAWPVYVAGDLEKPGGPGQGNVECGTWNVEFQPRDHVRFLGRLSEEELAGWFSRASIYALPARYEPFGLSILEAALSGCALVIGDIASLREVWGDAALYVSPNDPAHLQRQLSALIENDSLRAMMAGRALERARRYDLSTMASAYYTAYKDLLARRRGLNGVLDWEEAACTL